jgi:hypothetical protein
MVVETSSIGPRRSSRIQNEGKKKAENLMIIEGAEKGAKVSSVSGKTKKRKAEDRTIEDSDLINTPALPAAAAAAAAAAAVEDIAPPGIDWENSVENITQLRALGREFCLTQKKLDTLDYKPVKNPHYKCAAPMKLFAARDVWKAAIELWGSAAGIRDRAAQRADSAKKRRNTIARKKAEQQQTPNIPAGYMLTDEADSYGGGYSSGDDSYDSEGFRYDGRGRRFTDQYGEHHYDYPSSKKKRKRRKKQVQQQQQQQQTPNIPARHMLTDDYKNDVEDARAHLRKARNDIKNSNLPELEKVAEIQSLERRHNDTMNRLKTGIRYLAAPLPTPLADQIQVKREKDEEKHVIGPVPAAVPILTPTTAPDDDSSSSLADQIQVKCENMIM